MYLSRNQNYSGYCQYWGNKCSTPCLRSSAQYRGGHRREGKNCLFLLKVLSGKLIPEGHKGSVWGTNESMCKREIPLSPPLQMLALHSCPCTFSKTCAVGEVEYDWMYVAQQSLCKNVIRPFFAFYSNALAANSKFYHQSLVATSAHWPTAVYALQQPFDGNIRGVFQNMSQIVLAKSMHCTEKNVNVAFVSTKGTIIKH